VALADEELDLFGQPIQDKKWAANEDRGDQFRLILDSGHRMPQRTVISGKDMRGKSNPRWVPYYRGTMFAMRVVIIVSPVVAADSSVGFDWILLGNMFAGWVLLAKCLFVFKRRGIRYFGRIETCIEFFVCVGLLMCNNMALLGEHGEYFSNDQLGLLWSLLCLLEVVCFVDHLRSYSLVSKMVLIIFHALNTVSPFLYVLAMTYCLFAFVGMALFGGRITSTLQEDWRAYAGADLNRRFQYLNWNDFLSSLVYLWSINMNNQLPTLVNICAFARDPLQRDYSPLFFAVFFFLNNYILFNLFYGQIIAISINYFKQEVESKEFNQFFGSENSDSQRDSISVGGRSDRRGNPATNTEVFRLTKHN
jgi:hypothetical protein